MMTIRLSLTCACSMHLNSPVSPDSPDLPASPVINHDDYQGVSYMRLLDGSQCISLARLSLVMMTTRVSLTCTCSMHLNASQWISMDHDDIQGVFNMRLLNAPRPLYHDHHHIIIICYIMIIIKDN